MSISKEDIVRSEDSGLVQTPSIDNQPKADTRQAHHSVLHEEVDPFRKSFLKLYGCLFVAYLCAATNGYDGNTFGESTVRSIRI